MSYASELDRKAHQILTVDSLIFSLSHILLRPFQQPELVGLDGVFSGLEVGNAWLSCRLSWWYLPTEDWQPLADWFERAVSEFELVLPRGRK
jgi:hypothetical protein